jgi:diguanylate cyclase (GGDEF)-like protein
MRLDVPTLMIAGAFVALMSGALLLYAWYQYRETRAALWWAGADFVLACAIVLLAIGSGTAEPLIFFAGLTLICVSSTLTWAGARSFDGYTIPPLLLTLGTILWIGAQWLPALTLTHTRSVLLNSSITLAYYSAAALSIKLGRGEALRARLPLATLLAVHALTLVIAVPASLTIVFPANQPPPVLSWFGIIHFETLVFAIGTAMFLIVMMKERNEGRLLATSYTDALTGVVNRRGFFLKAERTLERCRRDGVPATIAVFDLDHFKAINDNFGHATGDLVLKVFVEVCGKMMRPGDLLGRLGGEEFAVIMPGSDVEAGWAIAERVRKGLADAGNAVDGYTVKCTVSGGVVASSASDDILELLRQADVSLYKAKAQGRNRIERPSVKSKSEATTNVIRVA